MDVDDIHFKIAAARRILARNGCESMVGGHVSARAEGEDAFYVSPFEYFDETLPDRIVKMSMDLEVLEGDWEASPAIRFHAGFYRARPDVNSVIHTHSRYVSIFATTRRTIGMYNVVSVLFHEDQALYEDDGTHPPVDPELMCTTLGNRRVLLIKNHGAIVVSQSLEKATIEACMLEVAAEYQVKAEAIGGTEFPDVEARRAREKYHRYFLPQMWDANFRRLRKSDPDLFAFVGE
jgi:L-fuculose-phosphate aldolase